MPLPAPLLDSPTSGVRRSRSRTLLLIAGGASALLVAAVAPGPAGANVAVSPSSQLTCDGKQATIYAGPDVTGKITGTRRDDVIVVVSDRIAWSGHPRQVIDAERGDDRVCTFGGWNYKVDDGPGRDRIWTGAGDDYIFGGAGSDTMSSGDGDDHLKGGVGAASLDYAYCGPGYDRVEKVSPYASFDCEDIVIAARDA